MPDHKEHAEAGFLPGVQEYACKVFTGRETLLDTYKVWASGLDEAKQQAITMATRNGHIDISYVIPGPV